MKRRAEKTRLSISSLISTSRAISSMHKRGPRQLETQWRALAPGTKAMMINWLPKQAKGSTYACRRACGIQKEKEEIRTSCARFFFRLTDSRFLSIRKTSDSTKHYCATKKNLAASRVKHLCCVSVAKENNQERKDKKQNLKSFLSSERAGRLSTKEDQSWLRDSSVSTFQVANNHLMRPSHH